MFRLQQFSTRQILILLCSISFLCHSAEVQAGFLRIDVAAGIKVNSSDRKVVLSVSLRNEGDEEAKEVGLSFPSLNRNEEFAASLLPQASTQSELIFTFEQLGIEKPGSYALPYHVSYKDLNYARFTAPRVAILTYEFVPARMIQFDLNSHVRLHESAEITGHLKNTGMFPIQIDEVIAFAPTEFTASVHFLSFEKILNAQASTPFSLELKSSSSALIGSIYILPLIVNGENQGRHFSEIQYLQVQIVDRFLKASLIFQFFAIVLAAVLVAGWYRNKAASNKPDCCDPISKPSDKCGK